jgi:hypothetical protein
VTVAVAPAKEVQAIIAEAGQETVGGSEKT